MHAFIVRLYMACVKILSRSPDVQIFKIQDRGEEGSTGQGRRGQYRTGWSMIGQDRTGQDEEGRQIFII
jgi:hypothetical protein